MRPNRLWHRVRAREAAVAALALVAAGCMEGGETAGDAEVPDTAAVAADTGVVRLADVGFQTPESVLHDERADVYLVSNINGGPMEKDDNGFIARVRPDGTVDSLRWIDGGSDAVTLHAPKGMAVRGDTLFVADIDSVRAFDRTTGAPLGARGIPNVSFLNDLAAGSDGLYVSDTGVDASFQPTGSAAVYRFEGDGAERIAAGEALAGPNGLVVQGGDVLVAPFAGSAILRIGADGAIDTVATLPAGQLDGLVRLRNGDLLVSSWESSSVYRVAAGGDAEAVVEGVESPADIGYDAGRNRLLIPLFQQNRVEVHPVR